jgi:tellurite methyltransferase
MINKFYNKKYSQKENLFGKDSRTVKKILEFVKIRDKLLDLGVGQGRLAVPLGKEGFEVLGVDLSEVGLRQFLEYAKKENVKARAICEDIYKFEFEEKFDLILSSVSLQFLGSVNKISKIINRMKKHTKIGGCNFISVPTKTKMAIDFAYMFKNKNELSCYYKDWEIIFVDELEGPYTNGKRGTTARILAKKIK